MTQQPEGWYERVEPKAGAGTQYRYRIDGRLRVPDPASRFQPLDVEGPSEVVDPRGYDWRDADWVSRPWREVVVYELHVGTFTPDGTYSGVRDKLEDLKKTGVTAIELMPLADFPGLRNWGYDGVLPYAPDSRYGFPDELKALVRAAHGLGLMIFLDVVYNHFGPKGNYLPRYAPQFFTERHRTPWGAAINYDGESSRTVRDFFIHNALYWLEEYNFDGLRFDAVHAIHDESPTHVLEEIASQVRERMGEKQIHLVLENDLNQAHFLEPGKYDAQWNDDSHHAYHVLATGETDGYYADYADAPARHLARCLAEGFAYQGDFSRFLNAPRGEPSAQLPPTAFVDFLQNHDQIGNRPFGERLAALTDEPKLKVLSGILLLAPSPPLLFMGEEWGSKQPFLFFCDYKGELGRAVREGRRQEFTRFAQFSDPEARKRIPDPISVRTFDKSRLRWKDRDTKRGQGWLAHYRQLLELRQKHIHPARAGPGRYRMLGERSFEVTWPCADGRTLRLLANCSDAAVRLYGDEASVFWRLGKPDDAWSVMWSLAAT